jgi:hypothetical protein
MVPNAQQEKPTQLSSHVLLDVCFVILVLGGFPKHSGLSFHAYELFFY